MKYRIAVGIRRMLIYTAFALFVVAMVRDHNPVWLFAGMPLIMIIYTDTCLSCGNVLFFCGGKTFWARMNLLYVPKNCPKCASEI